MSVDVHVHAGGRHRRRAYFLVIFEAEQTQPSRRDDRPSAAENDRHVRASSNARSSELKAHLRDTVEQYEGSTEELKASNEELQAMNEELRSATEELETSREELQSINEELTTVNAELKSKVDELAHANADLQQPDGGDRDRHRLPRPRAEHHAVHAVGGAALQPDPDATSAGRFATCRRGSTIRR